MSIDKIGMYKTDEILEFMTEGEGRGFLGRSMFDAMYFEIERLNNIINKATDYMTETIDFSWKDNSPIKNGKSLSLNKLYNILKGSDK